MSQRPVAVQVCCVCSKRFWTKADLGNHTSTYHGVNWHPAILRKAEDQMEFASKRTLRKPPNRVDWPVAFGE